MNDEATCLYEDIIDQMALGFKFIENEFGIKPNIGWQIDPFGHSAGNADIFTKLGFDALFFWRFHY